MVADEYGSNSYPWLLEIVDITPEFVFPEVAPKFTSKPEAIEVEFMYGQNLL